MNECNNNSFVTPGCSIGVTEGGICMNSKSRYSGGNGGFPYAMAPSPQTPAPVIERYGGGGGAGPASLRSAVKPWYMTPAPTIGVL